MLNPFEYHQPTDEQVPRIENILAAYWALIQAVNANTLPGSVTGRYAALAKTALEESAMWATKAVVFEGDNAPDKK